MKALSLYQPWALLVVHGIKKIETRPRNFHYRGPLLIHAAKRWNAELICLCCEPVINAALRLIDPEFPRDLIGDFTLPLGAFLGTVDVVDSLPCHEFALGEVAPKKQHTGTFGEIDLGNFTQNRYGIRLANPRRFRDPIPYKGRQGLFNVAEKVVESALLTAAAGR